MCVCVCVCVCMPSGAESGGDVNEPVFREALGRKQVMPLATEERA